MSNRKILIVMCNADPDKPETCIAPLFQATVAAALGHDVEVVLTGITGKIALPGVAQGIEVNVDSHQTLAEIIAEAYKAGVSFKACNTCHTSLKMAGEELIPEVEERIGAAHVIDEALDDNTLTLTY